MSHMPFDYVAPSLVKLANIAALFPKEVRDFANLALSNAVRAIMRHLDGRAAGTWIENAA